MSAKVEYKGVLITKFYRGQGIGLNREWGQMMRRFDLAQKTGADVIADIYNVVDERGNPTGHQKMDMTIVYD